VLLVLVRKSAPALSNLVTAVKGSAGGARGEVLKIVDWYMEGKINIDDLITHVMPLEHMML